MKSIASLGGEPQAPPSLKSIAQVERETELPRATLRIWERRYGFPAPQRDERGERCYPPEQVEQLRVMRKLLDAGHRPAKLLAGGAAEMQRLAGGEAGVAARPRAATQFLRTLRAHDAAALKHELEARLEQSGLERFAGVDLPAMNYAVGQAWFAGELEIHEEHLYSDCVYQVLRPAIVSLEQHVRAEAPQVLLTTLPDEPHGIGLLMAQALFALQGCPTVSLGVRMPVEQIASGAKAYRADLVGLSFTASQNARQVLGGLKQLRGMLPPEVRIWAGGSCPALHRRKIPGVRVIEDVLEIPARLAEDFALPPRQEKRS